MRRRLKIKFGQTLLSRQAAPSFSPSICLSLLIYGPLKSLTFLEFMKEDCDGEE